MTVKLWCSECRRTWPAEAQEAPGVGSCPVCGGGLRPDRRSKPDRRRARLQRMWDPEPRAGVDRRRSLPGASA